MKRFIAPLIAAVAAALATAFVVRQPIKYETRIRFAGKVYIHRSDSFSEALSWAKCYGPDWGGVATIWQGGEFVAAVFQGDIK